MASSNSSGSRAESVTELVYSLLGDHIRRSWPNHRGEVFRWTLGPINDSLPRFRIVRMMPTLPMEPWIYVSVGAWEVTRNQDVGLEFLMLSPHETAWHVETLAMAGNFHADAKHRLGLGSTVRIGREWIEGSKMDRLLVSLPYHYGPRVEWCDLGARQVRFLWLLPISASEEAFIKKEGVEAFEQRLEECGYDAISPDRPCVA